MFFIYWIGLVSFVIGESISNETISSTETNDFVFTTPFSLDENGTNETVDLVVPDFVVSKPVERVLRTIFRSNVPYCWRRSYGRGVGRPVHQCPQDSPEQDGLLCYPSCRDGYNGVGPVCWEKCENLTSLGFACVDVQKSVRSCPWYDKCGVFKRSCSSCPDNYTNFGCLCGRFHLRQSYGRGIGSSLICSDSYEQDGAICYEKCEKKYNGIGPVCWQNCPITQPHPCFAGCSITSKDCRQAVINMIQSVIGASFALLNILVGFPLVDLAMFDILASAAKGDWMFVARTISSLAGKLAERLLPDIASKFINWSIGTIQSATKNASLMITATALKDKTALTPFLKLLRLDSINSAFNHGKCDLPEDIDEIFD